MVVGGDKKLNVMIVRYILVFIRGWFKWNVWRVYRIIKDDKNYRLIKGCNWIKV